MVDWDYVQGVADDAGIDADYDVSGAASQLVGVGPSLSDVGTGPSSRSTPGVTCKYCGTSGLRWKETNRGYRLFVGCIGDERHICPFFNEREEHHHPIDRELFLLKLRDAIADKEWVTACANQDTARNGAWNCDYRAWVNDIQERINVITMALEDI